MLGNLLSHIREKKEMSKTNIAEAIGINVSHLTHIEKGERNPSQKTLRDICKAMNIPYLPVSYFYDKEFTEEQNKYELINSIAYDTVPLISNIDAMVQCPASIPNASFAITMKDDTMKASIPKGTTVFVEYGAMPLHREFGLVQYNGEFLIRRFVYRKNKLVLKADNLLTRDITILNGSEFTFIGKVHVEN